MTTKDQDLRTALGEDELKAAEQAVMAEWNTMNGELAKHGAPRLTWPVSPTNWRVLRAGWKAIAQRRAALTPAQAPDKAGERDGVAELVAATTDLLNSSLEHPIGDEYAEHPDDNDKRPGDSLGKNIYRARWNLRDRARKALAALAPQPNGTEASRGVGGETKDRCIHCRKLMTADEVEYLTNTCNTCEAQEHARWQAAEDAEPDAATPAPPLSPDSTGPADICHDDQLAIWSGDIIGSLGMGGYLREDISYEDKLHMYALVDAEIKGICATLTPSAPIAAPVRDDGARERIAQAIHDHNFRTKGGTVPWSVILQYPRYLESYEAKKAYGLTDAILAALCLTPASNVPGEAQTHASGWKNEHCNGEPEAAETPDVLVSGALADIATERRRQVEAEGWTPEHDDAHGKGEMAAAAACYAWSGAHNAEVSRTRLKAALWSQHGSDTGNIVKRIWPWDANWWKPKTCRPDLVRAGALILAEIERLDRSSAGGLSYNLSASLSASGALNHGGRQ